MVGTQVALEETERAPCARCRASVLARVTQIVRLGVQSHRALHVVVKHGKTVPSVVFRVHLHT